MRTSELVHRFPTIAAFSYFGIRPTPSPGLTTREVRPTLDRFSWIFHRSLSESEQNENPPSAPCPSSRVFGDPVFRVSSNCPQWDFPRPADAHTSTEPNPDTCGGHDAGKRKCSYAEAETKTFCKRAKNLLRRRRQSRQTLLGNRPSLMRMNVLPELVAQRLSSCGSWKGSGKRHPVTQPRSKKWWQTISLA